MIVYFLTSFFVSVNLCGGACEVTLRKPNTSRNMKRLIEKIHAALFAAMAFMFSVSCQNLDINDILGGNRPEIMSVAIVEVTSVSAKADVESENAGSLYYLCAVKAETEDMQATDIVRNGEVIEFEDGKAVVELQSLNPDTEYTLYLVASGENGMISEIESTGFRTNLEPGQDILPEVVVSEVRAEGRKVIFTIGTEDAVKAGYMVLPESEKAPEAVALIQDGMSVDVSADKEYAYEVSQAGNYVIYAAAVSETSDYSEVVSHKVTVEETTCSFSATIEKVCLYPWYSEFKVIPSDPDQKYFAAVLPLDMYEQTPDDDEIIAMTEVREDLVYSGEQMLTYGSLYDYSKNNEIIVMSVDDEMELNGDLTRYPFSYLPLPEKVDCTMTLDLVQAGDVTSKNVNITVSEKNFPYIVFVVRSEDGITPEEYMQNLIDQYEASNEGAEGVSDYALTYGDATFSFNTAGSEAGTYTFYAAVYFRGKFYTEPFASEQFTVEPAPAVTYSMNPVGYRYPVTVYEFIPSDNQVKYYPYMSGVPFSESDYAGIEAQLENQINEHISYYGVESASMVYQNIGPVSLEFTLRPGVEYYTYVFAVDIVDGYADVHSTVYIGNASVEESQLPMSDAYCRITDAKVYSVDFLDRNGMFDETVPKPEGAEYMILFSSEYSENATYFGSVPFLLPGSEFAGMDEYMLALNAYRGLSTAYMLMLYYDTSMQEEITCLTMASDENAVFGKVSVFSMNDFTVSEDAEWARECISSYRSFLQRTQSQASRASVHGISSGNMLSPSVPYGKCMDEIMSSGLPQLQETGTLKTKVPYRIKHTVSAEMPDLSRISCCGRNGMIL